MEHDIYIYMYNLPLEWASLFSDQVVTNVPVVFSFRGGWCKITEISGIPNCVCMDRRHMRVLLFSFRGWDGFTTLSPRTSTSSTFSDMRPQLQHPKDHETPGRSPSDVWWLWWCFWRDTCDNLRPEGKMGKSPFRNWIRTSLYNWFSSPPCSLAKG